MEQVTYNFSDKVVLVTGGTSGIGLATAQKFALAGAQVIITGRSKEKATAVMGKAGFQPEFICTDNSQPEAILELFQHIKQKYNRLDIAVNNAANETGIGKPLHEFELTDFEEAMAANLRGVWLCMQQEIRLMLEQQPAGGAIVNVASINGLGGAPGGALYSAAKAGVIAMAKSSAQELATSNIRVNVLAPGAHNTPMLQDVFSMQSGGDAAREEEVKQMYLNFIPQKRLGDPTEAAATIVWLCSDAASYITGHTLIVDGGTSAMMR
ncbi:SDR family NAD(P)-dependent oxidoreductase [Pontibacter cellulosilyticus]|uniref:SDR family oxidoreductase n=1 Tax=Pontibacter cellulosilyticus TaxID=1720253 RepID=A0A923N4U5_9BACT|nr:SDR family oxidoreductase [Pontibacter cellulosilyticus]MBC5992563.1 SDR family oxidoreductase [Pontibacter cellulosilyticus]